MTVTDQAISQPGMTRHGAKLGLLAAVVLRPGLWDATAAAWSRSLPHDYPGDHTERFAALVESGEASVLDLVHGGQRVGMVLVEIDNTFPAPELVVLGAFSTATGADASADCLPQIEEYARTLGCFTVRFHTMRPGLIGKSLRAGYRVSEVILRKSV